MKEQAWNKLRDKAGFTLVELIVVIAILGILAGIGTVGYSGYVKKANEAADQQLLGYINSAYAAACLENGEDMQNRTSASVSLTSDKMVASVNPYDDSFQKYYAGNENSKFKVIESLVFDAAKHVFVDPSTAGEMTIAYGGGVVKISSDDAKKLADSTFITAGGLGVENLMDKVNDVANFAALLTNSDIMNQVFSSPDFQSYAAQAMGITLTGNTSTDNAAFNAKLAELAQQMVDSGKATGLGAAQQKVLANAAIMYAANNAVHMDQSDIVELLSTDGTQTAIFSHMGGYIDEEGNEVPADPGKALTEAALAYGMYTAFVHSDYNTDESKKTAGVGDVIADLDNPDFQAYMKANQGTTDLTGYLSALNMINNSANDTVAVSSVVINGFNDPNLVALLNQALGQN